jgi:hypothetical protein
MHVSGFLETIVRCEAIRMRIREAMVAKAAKNTGLSRKNGADVFFVFFSPFFPGRCAEPVRAFWVKFCVFNGKFRQYFRNFHHFLHRFRKY